jgi:hypothetical protein
MNQTTIPSPGQWHFSGFAFPNSTSVPDQLFDELMPYLSGAELKVLLYIIRRTYGFKKSRDDISLSQMVNGIKKKNGEVLDKGTGLGKASVARALNSLEQKNIILRQRRSNSKNGDEATTYALNILSPLPVSQNETPPVPKRDTPVSHQRDTQQTVVQQTVKQQQQQQSGLAKSGVVVLTKLGMTKTVAERLASNYPWSKIKEKIDYLEFLSKKQRVKNPIGWLRKAIEEDYSQPDEYKSEVKRITTQAKEKQHLQAQEKLLEEREQQQRALIQQKETDRIKQLEMLREQHHTTEQEDNLWHKVLSTLKEQVTETAFKIYLAQSVLLAIQDGQALIALSNRFAEDWVKQRLATTIQKVLADYAGQQAIHLQFHTLDEHG